MDLGIILIICLAVMNILGFLSMGIDKRKAEKHKNRTPEKTLMLIAALGGAAGSWLGMEFFRHKTKHGKFVIGVPLLLFLQIGLLFYLNAKLRFLP